MNQKYNYLQNYLNENVDKTLDKCSVFDVDKFDLEQNVDYMSCFTYYILSILLNEV